jgi:hypothetical protein
MSVFIRNTVERENTKTWVSNFTDKNDSFS